MNLKNNKLLIVSLGTILGLVLAFVLYITFFGKSEMKLYKNMNLADNVETTATLACISNAIAATDNSVEVSIAKCTNCKFTNMNYRQKVPGEYVVEAEVIFKRTTLFTSTSCPGCTIADDGKKATIKCKLKSSNQNNELHCNPPQIYNEKKDGCKTCTGMYYQDEKDQDKCKKCYGQVNDAHTICCNAGQVLNTKTQQCEICPEGFYCSGGAQNPCPKGKSSVPGSKYENECSLCADGYYNNEEGGKCKKCNGTVSKDKTACYTGGAGSGNACYLYTDTSTNTTTYVYGKYSNQAGYTKATNVKKANCNKIILDKVDTNGVALTGAIVEFTDKKDANAKPVTYQINGKTEIKELTTGTYVIKETTAPAGHNLDATEITITVDSEGNINITGGNNLKTDTTNNSRNVNLTIVNTPNQGATPNEDKKYCYVKRENGFDNQYCYGNPETCPGFSEIVTNKGESSCSEEVACYRKFDGTFVTGKFNGQSDYNYYGEKCPACYKGTDGKYRWTDAPFNDESMDNKYNNEKDCNSANSLLKSVDTTKILYIAIIVIIVAIIFVLLKPTKKYQN